MRSGDRPDTPSGVFNGFYFPHGLFLGDSSQDHEYFFALALKVSLGTRFSSL